MKLSHNVVILFEDKHLIVCHKPSGLATQTQKTRALDLVSILKRHLYMQNPSMGEPYLGVIHRLDQPVSGILVFAKTLAAASSLSKQIQEKSFGKYYAALLETSPEIKTDTITHYLLKSSTDNISTAYDIEVPGSKKSILNYNVVLQPSTKQLQLFPQFENLSSSDSAYVLIKLETGRHHQIRVQMNALGCPILGDTKYGTNSVCNQWQTIALCAYQLEFIHPFSKEKVVFSIV